jgi:hypothetical protein
MSPARVLISTPRSAQTGGRVFGLGDPLGEAFIRGRTLDHWREGATHAQGMLTGPAFIYGEDTFATPTMEAALEQVGHGQQEVLRLARAPAGAGGLCDPLGRLPRDSVGRLLFDLWYVPPGVSVDPSATGADGEPLPDASPIDVDVRTRAFDVPADPEVAGAEHLTLTFAGACCGPVGHWVEVMRMNLLATGGQLLEAPKGVAVRRYLWAALKAGSGAMHRAAGKLNLIAKGAIVHPSAVVELSLLEEGARVGPGAVVRSSWLGRGARVGSQALCELSTVGDGAQVQRQGMCVAATLYPGARTGGVVQFGLCGRGSTQKMFAVGTDMKLDGPVKTPSFDGMAAIDIGYLGVGFGHRSFVGSGVWIAPGRFVPNEVRIARPADLMVLKPGEGR